MITWEWRHSRYQIENFIIRLNGVTPWGMFKQCMREMRARIERLTDPDIRREFNIIYSMAVRLYKEIGPFTIEKIKAMEEELWVTKMKRRALMELVTTGTIAITTMETLMVMPDVDVTTFFNLNRMTALQLLNKSKVFNFENLELVEIEEGASWQKMILEGFEIEAPIMDALLLETPNPKTP